MQDSRVNAVKVKLSYVISKHLIIGLGNVG
jgi:hypothetical protein